MATNSFSLDLGNGVYIDESGVISRQSAPAGNSIVRSPITMPIAPEKVVDVFKGIGNVLPDEKKPESRKFWEETLEMPASLVNFLQDAGEIAKKLAAAVPYVGAALAVLDLVGAFKKPDPVMDKLNKIEHDIKDTQSLIVGGRNDQRLKICSDARASVSTAVEAAKDYLDSLLDTGPQPALISAKFQAFLNARLTAQTNIRVLLDSSNWLLAFATSKYNTWKNLSDRTYYWSEDGSFRPTGFPAADEDRYDHRLLVPSAIYATQAYITMLKAYVPEHRTAAEDRSALLEFARSIESIARNMRNDGVALLRFNKSDSEFTFWNRWRNEPLDPLVFLAVGAFDLRSDTDALLDNPPKESMFNLKKYWGKHRSLELGWIAPALYSERAAWPGEDATKRHYELTNAEECANAANARSESLYAEMLARSGYFQLLHTAGLLRHLATDPQTSETVGGSISVTAIPRSSQQVKATSDYISFTGIIERDAELRTQDCYVTARVRTQQRNALGLKPMVRYRIMLRSLRHDCEYDDFWFATYQQSTGDPASPELVTTIEPTVLIDEKLILNWTESPPNIIVKTSNPTVEIKADTFDWYLPKESVAHKMYDAQLIEAIGNDWIDDRFGYHYVGEALEETSAAHRLMELRGTPSKVIAARQLVKLPTAIGNIQGDTEWPASKRHVKRDSVSLSYELRWLGSSMNVSIGSESTQRNFSVYLVLEEELKSGVILHTAFQIPMTNQLTVVDRAFFDDETQAKTYAKIVMDDFQKHYRQRVEMPDRGPPPTPWAERISVFGWPFSPEFTTKNQELLQEVVKDLKISGAIPKSLKETPLDR